MVDDYGVRTLATRVLARAERVERTFAGRDLVLAAPAAPARRPAAETDLIAASVAAPMRLSADPRGTREPSPPAVNVDRIADQVLQQLDRRVTAWRERLGRG